MSARSSSARARLRAFALSRPVRIAMMVSLTMSAMSLAATIVVGGWMMLPLPAAMASPAPVPSIVIQDRHGIVLRASRSADGERGGRVALGDVDPEIIQAFLAAEDRRFFEHHGIDPLAVGRALIANVRAHRVVSGASTITMQTARLLHPTSRTVAGKLAQALWALRLEAQLDKSRILEAYLNRVPLGQGAIGVAAASSLYFGASASDVSLGQAALLAGLADAPSRNNPFASPERARARRRLVLGRMAVAGFALPRDIARAMDEPIIARRTDPSFLAPHFTTRVLQRFGEADAPNGVLRTTLDIELQKAIEGEVRHTVRVLDDRAASQAAAVVLDNRTGDILAWVGSPDFFAEAAGQVDMVVSARQPGSTLKPFLYGLAFDRGYSPATVLPDVPHTFVTSTGPYRPQNYDRRFRGPVRVREALASSYNVPAVDMAERVGAGALLGTLRNAGFASLDRTADHYGLGLALGNGEVTLLELANAYRGLASGGVWRPERLLLDGASRGPVVWAELAAPGDGVAASPHTSAVTDGRRFVSGGAAALVLDILGDAVARVPGFGVETPLDFPFPAAAKTGTSRHFTDNWAVATTAGFTVAVWVGNFSGRPMQGVSGITGAGPLLYRAMLQTAKRYPPGALPTPAMAGAIAEPVCVLSGLRATQSCPSMIEWFLPGTTPVIADDWQRDGHIALPAEYAEWQAQNGRVSTGPADARPGRDVGGPQRAAGSAPGSHRILSPLDGDAYEKPPGIEAKYATLPLVATSSEGDPVHWSVDGRRVESGRWRLEPGSHIVRVVWRSGRTDSARVLVR